jgi:hypothetical protein
MIVSTLAVLVIAPAAAAAARGHELKLQSTIFAAQIGSTATGASVYAGAVVDPNLNHGAIVYSTTGSTQVRVIFHEYLALGSITGTGRITEGPATGGGHAFTGTLHVKGGTGEYIRARGTASVNGMIDSKGTTSVIMRGALDY